MRSALLFRSVPAFVLGGVLAACSGDESPAGTEDHTPATYSVLVNGTEMQPPLTFGAGQTATVQLKFFNAEDEDLDIIEDTHFGGLSFDPATLATATPDQTHNYRFTVTGGTPGTGTVQVSHGHDQAADETTFDPVPVTVEAAD
jgi:hypothetical protein